MEKSIFRASEVMDMAIQIEELGLSFYKACRQVENLDGKVIEVLDYLIDQESRHREIFSRMKSGLQDRPLAESYAGETRSYINSYVKDRIFYEIDKAEDALSDIYSLHHAIQFAIRFEKRSIDFYSAIKQMVRPSEHDVIENIINEEQNHIRRLVKLRQELET